MMDQRLKIKVLGLLGVRSKMSAYNKDWNKNIRTIEDGNQEIIYATDVSAKYGFKGYWKNKGYNVLGYETSKINEDGIIYTPTIKERYDYCKEIINKNREEEINNIFEIMMKHTDVKQFGIVYAPKAPQSSGEEKSVETEENGKNKKKKQDKKAKDKKEQENISIRGAVQIEKGVNINKNTNIIFDTNLSPYASADTKGQITNGQEVYTDDALYMHGFTITPKTYDDYIEMFNEINGFEFNGYTREDLEDFKKASLKFATEGMMSRAKIGCRNDFALFIETTENNNLALSRLVDYIKFEKTEEGDVYDLSKFSTMINDVLVAKDTMGSISKIEIYYNPYEVVGFICNINPTEGVVIQYKNILTNSILREV